MLSGDGFCDIVKYENGDTVIFRYTSSLCVYEEELKFGSLRSGGWNTAGYPVTHNGTDNLHAEDSLINPSVFSLELDGCAAEYGYEIEDFSVTDNSGAKHSRLVLLNDVFKIRVTVHTEVDGTGALVRYLEVENLLDRPRAVSRVLIFNAVLDKLVRALPYRSNVFGPADASPEKYFSLGYISDSGWAREGEFGWHALPYEKTVIDMRYTRSKFRHPLVFFRDNLLGRIWYMQTAFSAGCSFTLDRSGYEGSASETVSLCAELTSHNPMIVLRAGEKFSFPALHIGAVQGSLDDAVNSMHAHTRRITIPEADPTGCLVIGSVGELHHSKDVEEIKKRAREYAELGAEIFLIDAGWQCPKDRIREHRAFNGTNRPDPEFFPLGLAEISDYCHSLGMKFGIWTEIERIGNLSPVYSEHPEWRGVSMYGVRSETYLDMTNPEAAAWAESELDRMISEYKLDLLRIDHVNPGSAHFAMRDMGTGINECLSIRHYEAVYAMYERLKKKYPDVIFENCAGGGGRTDLGIMRFFNHTWVSDNQVMPNSVIIGNGMTLALPPERVDRLFASMTSHTHGSLDAHIRSTMLSHMSFGNPDLTDPGRKEFIRRSIGIYKDFIRPILPTARIYHHTPEAKECTKEGLCILEIASPDGSRGAAYAITLPLFDGEGIVFRPRGINVAKIYEITLDNTGESFTVQGHELSRDGILLKPSAAMCSELVLYREK